MVVSQLSMVVNGHLSMVINSYQGLLMVISQLSMFINGYWLSTSYQRLSKVVNGCQSVINGFQWLLVFNKMEEPESAGPGPANGMSIPSERVHSELQNVLKLDLPN